MLLALVIGELTNNSLKYGALLHRKVVSLSWTLDAETLSVQWREPLQFSSTAALEPRDIGSGYSLMQRMARSQGATFEHAVSNGELNILLHLRNRQRY